MASGFWGSLELEQRTRILGEFPISAAIALDKGTPFHLQRLSPDGALPRLLAVTLIPRENRLWKRGLKTLINFAHRVPIYSMKWSLNDTPRDFLVRELSRDLS